MLGQFVRVFQKLVYFIVSTTHPNGGRRLALSKGSLSVRLGGSPCPNGVGLHAGGRAEKARFENNISKSWRISESSQI